MDKNRFLHTVYILTTVCLITSMLLFNGCIDTGTKYYTPIVYSQGDNYKSFITVREGVPYFSFEYPSFYYLSDQTDIWCEGFGFVIMGGNVSEEEFMNGTIKDIRISIFNINQGFTDAESSMERTISFRKWSFQRNYKLIAKQQSVVGGIDGWETVISFRERPLKNIGQGIPRKPAFIIARDFYFDYQGITWEISLYTDADSYEKETRAVFEHILQTFKFHE